MNEAEENIARELGEVYERLKSAALHDNHNVQTIVHKTEGMSGTMGFIVGFSVATCVATWVGLILFGSDIHDLRAWRDIFARDLSTVQSHVSQLEHK